MQESSTFSINFNQGQEVTLLGLMSGTSLDGLDMALVSFNCRNPSNFKFIKATTFSYSQKWKQVLSSAPDFSGKELIQLDRDYGKFLGEKVNEFLEGQLRKPILVCSHGHTVFHQPELGFTLQIGHGGSISANCQLPVLCDFRSLDVALGGQGAPLVPIGDKLLWPNPTVWVNLGGIANLTIPQELGGLLAFDICPVNMALNELANQLGLDYDKDGTIAQSGEVDFELVYKLTNHSYFYKQGAKSLGREWYQSHWQPILKESSLPIATVLASLNEAISTLIAKTLNSVNRKYDVAIFTGGGAYNRFLISSIEEKTKLKCEVASKELVEFKEALIFAFLGFLWLKGQNNVLKEVTGSKESHIGGSLYRPKG